MAQALYSKNRCPDVGSLSTYQLNLSLGEETNKYIYEYLRVLKLC